MKLSYLLPSTRYTFFREMIPLLEDQGVEVEVDKISSDTDVVLPAILPQTYEWVDPLEESKKPFILWHWDSYSFVDIKRRNWRAFYRLLPKAKSIWSCTYEVARQLKENTGLDSSVVPSWVNNKELPKECLPTYESDYCFYAASSNSIGKRLDWAEHACSLLALEFESCTGQSLEREEYLKKIANCRVYIMTAFEESNATIPAQEAAACGRPVVLADIPANREVFGDTAYYFRNDSFQDLKDKIQLAYIGGPKVGCKKRIVSLYDLPVVFLRVLKELRLTLT